MKRTLLLICTAVFFMTLFSYSVHAVKPETSVSLPVVQSMIPTQNENTDDFEVFYTFTADTSDCPMPTGSENGTFAFSIRGNSRYHIPSVTIREQGIWHYTLSAKCDGLKFDYDYMEIVIYAVYDGNELVAGTFAKLPNGKKTELDFVATVIKNQYDISVEPSSEPLHESSSDFLPGQSDRPTDTVDTGDTQNIYLYIIVFWLSLCTFVALTCRSTKVDQIDGDNS